MPRINYEAIEREAALETVRRLVQMKPGGWTALAEQTRHVRADNFALWRTQKLADIRAWEKIRVTLVVSHEISWGARLAAHENRPGNFVNHLGRYEAVRNAYKVGRLMSIAMNEINIQAIYWPVTKDMDLFRWADQQDRIRAAVRRTSARWDEFNAAAVQTTTTSFYPTRGSVHSLLAKLDWKLTPAGVKIIDRAFPAQ